MQVDFYTSLIILAVTILILMVGEAFVIRITEGSFWKSLGIAVAMNFVVIALLILADDIRSTYDVDSLVTILITWGLAFTLSTTINVYILGLMTEVSRKWLFSFAATFVIYLAIFINILITEPMPGS
jgi:hypothetical protein